MSSVQAVGVMHRWVCRALKLHGGGAALKAPHFSIINKIWKYKNYCTKHPGEKRTKILLKSPALGSLTAAPSDRCVQSQRHTLSELEPNSAAPKIQSQMFQKWVETKTEVKGEATPDER